MNKSALALVLIFIGIGAPALAQSQPPLPASDIVPGVVGMLSSSEIIVRVRAVGFDPVTRPIPRGGTYVLRAIDPNDVDVHLVVDARTGRIVSVNPTVIAPPRYGGGYSEPRSSYPRPPGYAPSGPPRAPVVRPPGETSPYGGDFDDRPPPPRPGFGQGSYRGGASSAPEVGAETNTSAHHRTALVAPSTPLPRPRPNFSVTGSVGHALVPAPAAPEKQGGQPASAAQSPGSHSTAPPPADTNLSIVPVAPLE